MAIRYLLSFGVLSLSTMVFAQQPLPRIDFHETCITETTTNNLSGIVIRTRVVCDNHDMQKFPEISQWQAHLIDNGFIVDKKRVSVTSGRNEFSSTSLQVIYKNSHRKAY